MIAKIKQVLCNAAVGGLGVGSRNASPAPSAAFVHLVDGVAT